MTDAGAPGAPGGPSASTVAALVEAIDARARQAGQESASTLLRGMLGSVSDGVASIQDRLDQVEELLLGGGGGAGTADPAGVVPVVQEGLAAFNARLGRLEEAFLQAVDNTGSGTQAVVDEVRAAVVAALPAPAAEVPPAAPEIDPELRAAMVAAASSGDVVERAMRGVAARLDALEDRLASTPAPAPAPVVAPVDLGPVLARLDSLEARLSVEPAPPPPPVDVALEPVVARLVGLEQLVRSRAGERVDPGASVRAALAPLVERLVELEVASRSATEASSERFSRLDASLSALPGRLSAIEQRVSSVAATATVEGAAAESSVDAAAVLERLEAAVEHLRRDEASAQLVRLVEERLAAGMRAMAERADTVRRTVDELSGRVGGDEAWFQSLEALVRSVASGQERLSSSTASAVGDVVAGRFGPLGDRLSGLDARLDAVDARLAGIDDDVVAVHAQLEPVAALARSSRSMADKLVEVGNQVDVIERLADDLGALPAALAEALRQLTGSGSGGDADRITDVVRAEAELLTQRVAALAVGVEATRSLLEQHVAETEHSVGKKASELTRRIAADFGIRTGAGGAGGRRASGGRRDPREIGPG